MDQDARRRPVPDQQVPRPDDEVLRISCAECIARDSEVCADCVVTFLCSREPDDAVIIEVAEVRALQLLERGGLAPALRHRTG
jgi:hypothetical protein